MLLLQLDKYILSYIDVESLPKYYLTFAIIFAPLFGFWAPALSSIRPSHGSSRIFDFIPVFALFGQIAYLIMLFLAFKFIPAFAQLNVFSTGASEYNVLAVGSIFAAASLGGLANSMQSRSMDKFSKRNIISLSLGISYLIATDAFYGLNELTLGVYIAVVNVSHFILSYYIDYKVMIIRRSLIVGSIVFSLFFACFNII